HVDAGELEFRSYVPARPRAFCLAAAHHPTRPVRRRVESGIALDTAQDPRCGPHRARYQDRLAVGAQIRGELGVARAERTSGTFAVDAHRASSMFLQLGEVVGDVEYQVDPGLRRGEGGRERLPRG